jgi:hypothetical protein
MKRKLIKVLILLGGIVGFIYTPYLVGDFILYPDDKPLYVRPLVWVVGLLTTVILSVIITGVVQLLKIAINWINE